MGKPKLIIFASGTKNGGGSGFENLVQASRDRSLDAEIVAVVSNHEHGGVRARADRLGIPFFHFDPSQYTNKLENIGMLYRNVVKKSGAQWTALSGWLKHVSGLDPKRTFNIHPALLSFDKGRFGGKGMFGMHVHEAVAKALEAGELSESGLTMHFVTDAREHDSGPAFFEYRVPLSKGMTAEEIAEAVNKEEHRWQPIITNMVVHGEIRWDGKDPKSVVVPHGYTFFPRK